MNGLYDCHRNRVPVLAIAAQVPSSEIGTNYFQEADPGRLYADCTAYCRSCHVALSSCRGCMDIAIQTSLGLSAVTMIVISGDTAMKPMASERKAKPPVRTGRPRIRPSDTDLDLAAGILNRSEKVAILGERAARGLMLSCCGWPGSSSNYSTTSPLIRGADVVRCFRPRPRHGVCPCWT